MSALDITEIRNLVATLAIAADEGDVATYETLFAPDAVWEMRLPPLDTEVRGLAEIKAQFIERISTGFQGPSTGQIHSVTSHAVKVDGDRATGKAYMVVHTRKGRERKLYTLVKYLDEYVRHEGRWVIARRVLTPAGLPEQPAATA